MALSINPVNRCTFSGFKTWSVFSIASTNTCLDDSILFLSSKRRFIISAISSSVSFRYGFLGLEGLSFKSSAVLPSFARLTRSKKVQSLIPYISHSSLSVYSPDSRSSRILARISATLSAGKYFLMYSHLYLIDRGTIAHSIHFPQFSIGIFSRLSQFKDFGSNFCYSFSWKIFSDVFPFIYTYFRHIVTPIIAATNNVL